ncbi:hypothetical protein B7494_g444 [Chlorociboria aeruginascens]|nr:hypothetical protein B7494_g444 [Chlorociboria aeruginascens]
MNPRTAELKGDDENLSIVQFPPIKMSAASPLEVDSQSASPVNQIEEQQVIPATTNSLDSLQSDEQRHVLNIVDSLRQCGLDGILSLPQLVVCGDQSSGKSSVLEAITEIPFPRRENLCTRFATEIILRRAPISAIETKIIPDPTRIKAEQDRLNEFKKTISDFKELPHLIDEATERMGLDDKTNRVPKAFTKDILRIEISGPDRPQLTLVDLPGLIHTENKSQSQADVQLISELVTQYITNPRTIILPIISAKNDYANQVILKRAREVDEHGIRTLGIITKPDDLHPGSENEAAFISLAKNEDIFFTLGWHIVKNRGYNERNTSFEERNLSERAFFNKGNWKDIPEGYLGIESLRKRLSDLLYQHVREELPKLREELDNNYEKTNAELVKLGAGRADEQEQRQFLIDLSLKFYNLVRAGTNGHYEASFFRQEIVANPSITSKTRRLRAEIQRLNLEFSTTIRKIGHKYNFTGTFPMDDEDYDQEKDNSRNRVSDTTTHNLVHNLPKSLSESQSLDWVMKVLSKTRGKELPGNFNPLLIGELFWEQSEKWEEIALDHTEDLANLCTEYVAEVLKSIAPPDVCGHLQTLLIRQVMKKRFEGSQVELQKIVGDKRRLPMTYNHYYTLTIDKIKRKRDMDSLKSCLKSATVPTGQYDAQGKWTATTKVSLKTFVDNIAAQVVERHIVDGLEDVFSPKIVVSLDEADLLGLAGEAISTTVCRRRLEEKKIMIEKGRTAFRSVLRDTTSKRKLENGAETSEARKRRRFQN